MKIAVLLPYKENFSKNDTGAVSIFVNSINKLSKFKNNITIYGSTNFKPLSKNYKNLNFKKKFFQSSSKIYIKDFLKNIKIKNLIFLKFIIDHIILNIYKNLIILKKLFFFITIL
jgi:hypothetical protein